MMTLSRDELRRLERLDRSLSRQEELSALTRLFAEPPRPGDPRPQQRAVAERRQARRRFVALAAGILLSSLDLAASCVLASVSRQGVTLAAATALALSSGAGFTAVTVQYMTWLRKHEAALGGR